MKLPKILLASVLSLSLVSYGCSSSQVIQILNEIEPAVVNILQIIALFRGVPANLAIATKIGADVSASETIYTDYENSSAASRPGIQGTLQAAFSTLNSDLNLVLSTAQVSDPATQQKITALIGLVETSVSIAEAAIPAANPTMKLAAVSKSGSKLNIDTLLANYNAVLVAPIGISKIDQYTRGHKLHNHSKLVRVLTGGIAK